MGCLRKIQTLDLSEGPSLRQPSQGAVHRLRVQPLPLFDVEATLARTPSNRPKASHMEFIADLRLGRQRLRVPVLPPASRGGARQ
jgi:hypothetical protein